MLDFGSPGAKKLTCLFDSDVHFQPSRGGNPVPPPTSNTLFIEPRVYTADGISVRSPAFAVLTVVNDKQTDQQTDHATPAVAVGRADMIYVRCGLESLRRSLR